MADHCCICHGVCSHEGKFIYCEKHKYLGEMNLGYIPFDQVKKENNSAKDLSLRDSYRDHLSSKKTGMD